MLHLDEFLIQITPYPLRGRVGIEKIRIFGFELFQFLQFHIKFIIADRRIGQNIVLVIMFFQFFSE